MVKGNKLREILRVLMRKEAEGHQLNGKSWETLPQLSAIFLMW